MRYRPLYTLFQRGKKSGGKVWYYRLASDPHRRAHSTGRVLKHRAIEYVEELFDRGDCPTFGKYTGDFFIPGKCIFAERRKDHTRGASLRMHRSRLENHLWPVFRDQRLDEITVLAFERWWIALPLAAQTKNHIKATMNIIMREAQRQGLIEQNPISLVQAMKVTARRRDVLTLDELARLFPHDWTAFCRVWDPPMFGVMCALGVSGGLRSQEVRALRWRDIVWDLGGILVRQAIKSEGDVGPPKTAGSFRGVLVPDRTMELLRWWHDEQGETWADAFVFTCQSRKELLVALRRGFAGASLETAGRYLDFHSLRHTYNTIMRDMLDENIAMEFSGHRNAAVARSYDHRDLERKLRKRAGKRETINRFWPSGEAPQLSQ